MDSIVTFEQKLGTSDRALIACAYPSSSGDRTPPSTIVAASPVATAEVYQGRWLAKCPFGNCSGAEYVSFDDPHFFCHECRNAAVEHALVPITVPAATTRKQIEAYLLARPERRTRNWLGHETVADLRNENRANKIRLP